MDFSNTNVSYRYLSPRPDLSGNPDSKPRPDFEIFINEIDNKGNDPDCVATTIVTPHIGARHDIVNLIEHSKRNSFTSEKSPKRGYLEIRLDGMVEDYTIYRSESALAIEFGQRESLESFERKHYFSSDYLVFNNKDY